MITNEHLATARGSNLGISTKFAREIGKFVCGKKVSTAKKLLNEVIDLKIAVPFKRYNFDLGHKRGSVGPARFPVKAAKEMLNIIESAEMNATNKGLDEDNLYVYRVISNKGSTQFKAGRHRGRHAKRTHIQVYLAEKERKKEEKKVK
jgi:large subunit ribosomal protein L22